MTKMVRAAGGLLFKENKKGQLRVLVAHRPKYNDWGLPKGKADRGETPEETAIREVLEETGYNCRIVAPLGITRYRINTGIKEVRWYAMRPLPDSPGFKRNKEIDEIRWLSRKRAKSLVDYENDRDLIGNEGLRGISRTGTIHLARHGAAGDRNKWKGDDNKRPLTKKGHRQAQAIADRLKSTGIERVVSSPALRCIQTGEPLAAAVGTKVEVDSRLAEGPDVDGAYEAIDSVVGANTLVISHGDVIPAVINRMMWAGLTLDSRFYCSKGSVWEIEVAAGRFGDGHYHRAPKV